MTCFLGVEPTQSSISEILNCLEANKQVAYVSEWTPLVEKYFKTEQDQHKALRIIYCESRGKPTAVGINKDGSKDIGLFQFNDNTWEWLKPKLKITSTRYDPEVSTAVASWLVYNDGWYHWNSSKHCWGNNNDR